MIELARASVRRRATTFAATFLSLLLGTTLIGSFATLVETSFGEMSVADTETLRIVGMIIGSWGTLIVLFSVASTLTVSVGQRAEEIGLLRVVGATPRQVRRLIHLETAVVAVVAACLGAALAWPAGQGLFHLLRGGGMIDDTVPFGGTALAPAVTVLAVVLTALLAATITGRRATSGSPLLAVHDARSAAHRMRWWRIAIGLLLVGYGLIMAMITITVTGRSDDPYAAMATSGSSSILVGIGLATLSPAALRLGTGLLRPIVSRGAAGWLAVHSGVRAPSRGPDHLCGSVGRPALGRARDPSAGPCRPGPPGWRRGACVSGTSAGDGVAARARRLARAGAVGPVLRRRRVPRQHRQTRRRHPGLAVRRLHRRHAGGGGR
jgi:putative ABC transport system permease protein